MTDVAPISYNSKNTVLRTIDRELFPAKAQKIELQMPSNGTNVVLVDLEDLWNQFQFSANGIIVDLSHIAFFSAKNPPLSQNTFQGGGPLGAGMGINTDYNTRLSVITPSGARYFCDCGAVTNIPLNGDRSGTLEISWYMVGNDDSPGIGLTFAAYPMSADLPSGTGMGPASFTATLVNVPIRKGSHPVSDTILPSVFDGEFDESGPAAQGVYDSEFETGSIRRAHAAVTFPQRIVTFQGYDLGGPFCAPDSPSVSRYSGAAFVNASTISNVNIINGGYSPPNKKLQHLTINKVRLFVNKLLLTANGMYYFQLYVNLPSTPLATAPVEICSFPFDYNGQEDFEFNKKLDRYINILDVIGSQSNPNALNGSPYISVVLYQMNVGDVASYSCNYNLEIMSTIIEDVPQEG